MGSDKTLIEVGGVTLLERSVSLLYSAGANPVVVVGGAAPGTGLGASKVADLHPGEGPLGAIITALEAVDTEVVLVIACDLPALDRATLQRLVDEVHEVDEAPGCDVAMAHTDRPEPLCSAWRRRCLPALGEAFEQGERSPQRALGLLQVVHVPVDPHLLVNLNTPADLAAFRQAAN